LKILIAPLDWGLGHTTRCIPLIQYFISEGHDVYAAAETASAQLLRENFPELPIFPLKGYRILYSSHRATFSLKIAQQIPRILSAISAEQKWLQQMQKEQKFDLIISDNRYGIHHAGVPSVILTHQLQIQSGINARMDSWVMKLHMRLIRKFNACWIVDEESNGGYSGKLAHPERLPEYSEYIGLLSQFSNCNIDYTKTKESRILILLSGAEPMRSMFESRLIAQARNLPEYEFVIAGGNPLGERVTGLPDFIKYYTHLNAANLLVEMETASLVICRSGYSTVMDLALLQKKALLIPTPGQSEQEYLARFLIQTGAFHAVAEYSLNLKPDIMKALGSGFVMKPIPFAENMKKVAEPFIRKIKL
jgi:UDP:flavonoid glycosyltransferase YjiC (YdhE family)